MYMNAWGLWYRHTCQMCDDLNQMKSLSLYQARETYFPYVSPPITDNIMNEFGCTNTYYNMNNFCKML